MLKKIILIVIFAQLAFTQTLTTETKKTLSDVIIDGVIDEEVWQLSLSADKLLFGTKNNSVTFGTLWDDVYLYVAVKVVDDNLFNDSGGNEWEDDGIEFYIDADFNKSTSYDSFDRQFRKVYGREGASESSGNTSGLLHAYSETPDGYSVEIAIPWSNLNIDGTAGTTIGFDIANNDDDDGGARESQIVWYGIADNWNNTSEFGELTLSSETVGEEIQKESITRENVLLYYSEGDEANAESIAEQIQDRIDYFKRYDVNRIFDDDDKIFTLHYCKDISEFNEIKPDGTEEIESSYILGNNNIYFVEPQTSKQLEFIGNLEMAAMFGFARAFIRHEYTGQPIHEWAEYGFASVQANQKIEPDYIKQQVQSLGRKPEISDLENWNNITEFDKYAFAHTAVEFIERRYSYTALKYRLIFNASSTNYGFRNISSESDFNNVWHFNLDLFYLNDTERMELQLESENFVFYATDEDYDLAVHFIDLLENAYTEYSTNLDFYFQQKTKVYMYPYLNDGNTGGEGISIDQFVFTSPRGTNRTIDYIDGIATHEYAHIFHKNIKKQNGYRWVSEGFASFMPGGILSTEVVNDIKSQVNSEFNKVLSIEGRYPTIEDLNNITYSYSKYGLDEYLLGMVIMDFIVKEHGFAKLKDFLKFSGNDYSMLGYNNQEEFQDAWYSFYDEHYKYDINDIRNANIKKILSELNLDGNLNESIWDLSLSLEKAEYGSQNNTVTFGGLWDDEYLYTGIKVLDGSLINDSGQDYHDDGVEIYIDADFNKGTTYDSYDRQFVITYGNQNIREINDNTDGVIFSLKTISGGYTVELAVPWSNLGITASANTTIGLDIANNDDDDGGGRDSKLFWSGNDNNWQSTISFGEVTLSGDKIELDENRIEKKINALNLHRKKDNASEYQLNIVVISSAEFESQKPANALAFDCGYVNEQGKVYVSEPTTAEQLEVFTDIDQAAIYYICQSFLQHYYQTTEMPLWFKTGFASYESDMHIDDEDVKTAYNNYNGTLTSFDVLNDPTSFLDNNGLAISYLFGEFMGVYTPWKYYLFSEVNATTITPAAWWNNVESIDKLFEIWLRYFNVRILETNEQDRIKLGKETEHFKYYYREADDFWAASFPDILEDAFSEYVGLFGFNVYEKFSYITMPECDFAAINDVECINRYTGGTAWSSGVSSTSPENADDVYRFVHLIRHELAHLVQTHLPVGNMTAWLNEGFAEFLSRGPDTDDDKEALKSQTKDALDNAISYFGHLPTYDDTKVYPGQSSVDYYLLGRIMHNFIYERGSYTATKEVMLDHETGISSMGFSSLDDFMKAYYHYVDVEYLQIAEADYFSDYDTFITKLKNLTSSVDSLSKLNTFWDDLIATENFPFAIDTNVAFLYRGTANSVNWAGDFNGWNTNADGGVLLGVSNIWLLEKEFPSDARSGYKIVKNGGEWIIDEHNPYPLSVEWGNSDLRMPDYEIPYETIPRPSIPKGELSDNILKYSSNLNYNCQYRVYTPANYSDLSELPVIYVTDGQAFSDDSKGKMKIILDNLIYDGIIEPIIAIFLEPTDRSNEYRNNINFVNYVTKELIPDIDAAYKTEATPGSRAIAGYSYGGYNAAYFCAMAYEYIQNTAILSPIMHPNPPDGGYNIHDDLMAADLSNMKIYMSYGIFDTREKQYFTVLKNIFEQKNKEFDYDIVNEGHTMSNWSGVIGNALKYFYSITGNSFPVVSDIPNQIVMTGNSFTPIELDDYVTDEDNADSEILWTFNGNNELSVEIDENRISTITAPYSEWTGSETITFTATDPSGDSDSDQAVFTVNDVNDDLPDYFSDYDKFITKLNNLTSSVDSLSKLNTFWDDLIATENFPFAIDTNVAFLYRGTANSVNWAGDFNGWNTNADAGFRLGVSNIWLLEKEFPSDARSGYKIVKNGGEWIIDEHNPYPLSVEWGNSDLRMPDYEIPYETIPRPSIPKGELSDNILKYSSNLNYNCQYRVYTPANYSDLSELPVIYVTDGQAFSDDSKGKMKIILDNLIYDGIIEPIIAIFLEPTDRSNEYRNNINFVNYVTKELIPDIDAAYKTEATPGSRAIAGYSYGGYNAAYFCAMAYEYIQNTAILSPIMHPNPPDGGYNIHDDLMAADLSNMKIYMSYGIFDTREKQYFTVLKNIFEQKNKEFDYDIVNEGHTMSNWSGVIGNALKYFYSSPGNSSLVVSDIPDQTVTEGDSFKPIELDDCVNHADNEDSEISWSFSGNNELSIEVDDNRMATISIPSENWFGSETITFTATDLNGVNASNNVTFTVTPINDSPVISNTPDIIEFRSDSTVSLNIWEFISDVETPDKDLSCEFNIESDSIQSEYNAETGILKLRPYLEFGGESKLTWSVSDSFAVVKDTILLIVDKFEIVSIDDNERIPETFKLFQNYPNPFNPSTSIKYSIPKDSHVNLIIYDSGGKIIDILVNSRQSAGNYTVKWMASKLPSGIYFYRINAGDFNEVHKCMLIK